MQQKHRRNDLYIETKFSSEQSQPEPEQLSIDIRKFKDSISQIRSQDQFTHNVSGIPSSQIYINDLWKKQNLQAFQLGVEILDGFKKKNEEKLLREAFTQMRILHVSRIYYYKKSEANYTKNQLKDFVTEQSKSYRRLVGIDHDTSVERAKILNEIVDKLAQNPFIKKGQQKREIKVEKVERKNTIQSKLDKLEHLLSGIKRTNQRSNNESAIYSIKGKPPKNIHSKRQAPLPESYLYNICNQIHGIRQQLSSIKQVNQQYLQKNLQILSLHSRPKDSNLKYFSNSQSKTMQNRSQHKFSYPVNRSPIIMQGSIINKPAVLIQQGGRTERQTTSSNEPRVRISYMQPIVTVKTPSLIHMPITTGILNSNSRCQSCGCECRK